MKLSDLMNFTIQQIEISAPETLHRNCLLAQEPIIPQHRQMILKCDMEQLSANTLMLTYKEWNY